MSGEGVALIVPKAMMVRSSFRDNDVPLANLPMQMAVVDIEPLLVNRSHMVSHPDTNEGEPAPPSRRTNWDGP